jgi:hypothetical protein
MDSVIGSMPIMSTSSPLMPTMMVWPRGDFQAVPGWMTE